MLSREEFAMLRLRKEAMEDGVFLLRWSALDYHRILLAVMNSRAVRSDPRARDRRCVVLDTVA